MFEVELDIVLGRLPKLLEVSVVWGLVEAVDPVSSPAYGIGEGGLLPVASAVANAVARAVGVRIQELPLTPPKIWQALQRKQ